MPLALLLLLHLPGEVLVGLSLLVLFQFPHVALLISLCLIQVSLQEHRGEVRTSKGSQPQRQKMRFGKKEG